MSNPYLHASKEQLIAIIVRKDKEISALRAKRDRYKEAMEKIALEAVKEE